MPELEVLQQQQQKAKAEAEDDADADAEFRRRLEELVRASCSGTVAGAAVEGGRTMRRRRGWCGGRIWAGRTRTRTGWGRHRRWRSSSRILGRWAARQAQEMITTMEHRNREPELMALAGLHTVSMLDSSFLRESRVSCSPSPSPPPVAATSQASALLQMWRELEDEHLLNRARDQLRAAGGGGGGGSHGRGGSLRSGEREMGERRRIAPAGATATATRLTTEVVVGFGLRGGGGGQGRRGGGGGEDRACGARSCSWATV